MKRYKKLYQKHGVLRVKRRNGSVNDIKYSELMRCISRCCNVLTVKLYQLIVGSTEKRTDTFGYRFFLLYKENHALDAWFSVAYGGE